MLANHKMAALNRAARQAEIRKPAEGLRVLHDETDALDKERDRSRNVFGLPLERGEHAARNRAAALMDKEIGVAERGEPIIESEKGTVGGARFKDVPGGDGVRDTRARGEDARLVGDVHLVVKANLNAEGDRLLKQRAVEAAALAAAPYQIEEWPLALKSITPSSGETG